MINYLARSLLALAACLPTAILAQTNLGAGCGTPSPALSIDGAPTIPNPSFAISAQSSPNASLLLLYALRTARSDWGNGCIVYLDPLTLFTHGAVVTSSSGRARAPFPIPNVPSLAGATINWQALQWQSRGPMLGLATLSNGLQVRLSLEPNFPRLLFSINTSKGISAVEWNVLTRYADLVSGLDEHGYDFPGLLDDFRRAAPKTPAYAFFTSMGIQRSSVNDWRFRYLDRYEDAFLHCGDPASLKVVVIGSSTRLFWVRDYRRTATTYYRNPIGVASYVVESAPSKSGPWVQHGAPIVDRSRTAYYEASVSATATNRWYRIRARLADSATYTGFSWATRPDTSATGFAYLKTASGPTFTAGVWGAAPSNASDVVFEWGNQYGWGYASTSTSKSGPINGITEYTGSVTRWPSSGAWVTRLRSTSLSVTSMRLDVSRRNNRLISKFGERLFKPDHPNVLAMHRSRLAAVRAQGLTGARLDFVIDSWPKWYVPTAPLGDDATYTNIEPRMLSMLKDLKAHVPQVELILNGLSVTSHYTGIFDYVPPASGVDCEYIGYSSPNQAAPFREYDMLDGVIAAAHVRDLSVTCYSYSAETDIAARITSLARYWLVYRPTVYYQYMTGNYHLTVDYFPEYDVDMGHPVIERLQSRNDLRAGSVYRREFTKGSAFYNPNSFAVTVSFRSPHYIVSAQGGHSPKLGGTGSATFNGPVSSMVLASKRGAIVVRRPGLGR